MVETEKKLFESQKPGTFWSGAYWCAILIVYLLAVPSVGFIFAMMIPDRRIGQLLVFVLSCWACTYLGMRLMKK